MKKLITIAIFIILSLVVASVAYADFPDRAAGDTTIFVTGQGVSYETILLGELPMHGRFQQLQMGPDGPFTEFGPGDPGYLGGRWWVDANGDGEMNEGDVFFLCPLIGPAGH